MSKIPILFFLLKQKVVWIQLTGSGIILGMRALFVCRRGMSGGLGFIWWCKQDLVQVIGSCDSYIDVVVSVVGELPYHLIGYYGVLASWERRRLWDVLRSLVDVSTLPWVILGDFNYLLF